MGRGVEQCAMVLQRLDILISPPRRGQRSSVRKKLLHFFEIYRGINLVGSNYYVYQDAAKDRWDIDVDCDGTLRSSSYLIPHRSGYRNDELRVRSSKCKLPMVSIFNVPKYQILDELSGEGPR